jgi:hypothetical protein
MIVSTWSNTALGVIVETPSRYDVVFSLVNADKERVGKL